MVDSRKRTAPGHGKMKTTGSRVETAVLTRRDQIDALTSPLRMEILQAFAGDDSCTVAELASRVGRPAESLYYHVRMLTRLGILVEVDRRLKGRKYESVYRPIAPRIALGVAPHSGTGRDAALKSLRTALRLAEREFQAAWDSGRFHSEDAGTPVGRRLKGRLSANQQKKLSQHLESIEKLFSVKKRSGGRSYSVTIVTIPLEG